MEIMTELRFSGWMKRDKVISGAGREAIQQREQQIKVENMLKYSRNKRITKE